METRVERIGRTSFGMVHRMTTPASRYGPARLIAVADLAGESELALIPTLFTGHMSGVNWIPAWALGGSDGAPRFRVVSGGRVAETGLRNWYSDAEVGAAQALFAAEAAAALTGHAAVWAWDLGNENSNCVIPRPGQPRAPGLRASPPRSAARTIPRS